MYKREGKKDNSERSKSQGNMKVNGNKKGVRKAGRGNNAIVYAKGQTSSVCILVHSKSKTEEVPTKDPKGD